MDTISSTDEGEKRNIDALSYSETDNQTGLGTYPTPPPPGFGTYATPPPPGLGTYATPPGLGTYQTPPPPGGTYQTPPPPTISEGTDAHPRTDLAAAKTYNESQTISSKNAKTASADKNEGSSNVVSGESIHTVSITNVVVNASAAVKTTKTKKSEKIVSDTLNKAFIKQFLRKRKKPKTLTEIYDTSMENNDKNNEIL